MSNNTLYIPTKLKAGFNDRPDTYSGKLAYVIYWDEKGKLRKENSWESWRSKKKSMEPLEFNNEPTEGFVINKGGGGARECYGWNARNEFIRVFDPRGFEFEISVANLIFILQEGNSFKGKGLEGKFVYSWDGKELVLLPVASEEYETSYQHTARKSKKVTAKDMEIGREYITKNGKHLVYLGRGMYHDYNHWNYDHPECRVCITANKMTHIYGEIVNGGYTIIGKDGFTHLAEKVSELEFDDIQGVWDAVNKTDHFQTIKDIKIVGKFTGIPIKKQIGIYSGDIYKAFGRPCVNALGEVSKTKFDIYRIYKTNNSVYWNHFGRVANGGDITKHAVVIAGVLRISDKGILTFQVTPESRQSPYEFTPPFNPAGTNFVEVEVELSNGNKLAIDSFAQCYYY